MFDFPKEKARIIKQDQSVIEDVDALFDRGTIFVDDASIPIEDGDIIERTLLNGINERYLVTDNGFFSGSAGIPAHYQVKVEKMSMLNTERAGQGASTGSNSFSINLTGASISNIQIQQGTTNSSQISKSSKGFNYDAVSEFLNQIKKYDLSKMEFGENSGKIQEVIEETERAVECQAHPSTIKRLLHTLRDLAIGATGSLIASGIASQIPSLLTKLGL